MSDDPVSGPMPREKLRALAEAPHGDARDVIRQYDPFWGLPPGATIEYEVELRADVSGYALVKASSIEEARKLAANLNKHEVEFDPSDAADWKVMRVEPVKPPPRRRSPEDFGRKQEPAP